MNYFLGIETSITATKALLMDAIERVVAIAGACWPNPASA